MQCVEPVLLENVPASHLLQIEAPVDELEDPVGHGRHCNDPGSDANVPALHLLQTEAPVVEFHDPGGHTVQCSDPGRAANEPAGQMVHDAREVPPVVVRKRPIGQGVHTLLLRAATSGL